MGLADIPIDMANILIASIALGIAVDDTIHFLHHFHDHYKKEGDTEAAILHSMAHSGRALVVTSIILCAGFFVYIAAIMVNMQRFGALIGITVIMALLLDLIVTPALLRTFYKQRETTEEEGQHA
jgi:predicted RND superfamily exporter protein